MIVCWFQNWEEVDSRSIVVGRGTMNKDKIFKLAKGFRGRAKNCIRIARERVEKALQYSYRDRRNKKRDMRSLWIERINAGARLHGVCLVTIASY